MDLATKQNENDDFTSSRFSDLPSRKIPDHAKPKEYLTWKSGEKEPPSLQIGSGVRKFAQEFIWSEHHLTKSELDPWRGIGDTAMDAWVARNPKFSSDPTTCPELLKHLVEPKWADWEKVYTGSRILLRYLPLAGLTLFYLSLVGGFSIPRMTRVLASTGYLTSKKREKVMERLGDTGVLVAQLGLVWVASIFGVRGLHVGGFAWRTCIRVRALHSRVRVRLMRSSVKYEKGKRCDSDDGRISHNTNDSCIWNKNEIPINQEDLAAVLLAFSYNVLVGIEMLRGGRPLAKDDQEAYLHLWAVVGHYLGVSPIHNPCSCENVAVAKARLDSTMMHLLEPDTLSRQLVHNIISAVPTKPGTEKEFFNFRSEVARQFFGDALGDALGLPKAPEGSLACTRAQNVFTKLDLYAGLLDWPILRNILEMFHLVSIVMFLCLKGHVQYILSKDHDPVVDRSAVSTSSCPFR